jgi:putative ABC transport system permease protein
MFRNYLIVAWRSLTRQKVLSFISVFGLAAGIACFSLCAWYAVYEFSFDRWHKNAANIYRVDEGGSMLFTPAILAPSLKADFPDVVAAVRYIQPFEHLIRVGKEGAREKIAFADPAFFSVFSFPLKAGNPTMALEDPHAVVLTESMAQRLFGKEPAIGKVFEIEMMGSFYPFRVSAIAADPPGNTTLPFGILCTFKAVDLMWQGRPEWATTWNWVGPYFTYVQLKPGSRLPQQTRLLAQFEDKYEPLGGAGSKKSRATTSLEFQALTKNHNDSRGRHVQVPPVDPQAILILIALATGVLVIACINFTTLAIGRSAGRAREVGVRKVIGGSRRMLITQFLTESMLLTFIATLLGLGLARLLLPLFERLSGAELELGLPQLLPLAASLAGVVLLIGFLTGAYPALVLSGFRPVEVLKARFKLGGSNLFTRSLVTIQFVLSAGLLIVSVIMLQQLHFIRTMDPGFNKENVIAVNARGIQDAERIYPFFKQALAARPEIIGTASGDNSLGDGGMSTHGYGNRDRGDSTFGFAESSVDPDFIPILGMQLLAGRNFDPTMSLDTTRAMIINEAMMHALGLTLQNAVGAPLKGYLSTDTAPVVIGVVRNFNFSDLHQEISPQLFNHFPANKPRWFLVRIRPGDPSKAIADISAAWKDVSPDIPLKYSFLEEDLDRLYKAEQRLSGIIVSAGTISVILACLGLFGLATLAAVNRTREIGIRKVMGASVPELITLLSKDLLRLVGIAFILATPIAWWLMHRWLQDYAYRISIQWWVFALSAAAMLGVAILTIGFQAAKAALENPVKSLRTE